MTAMAALALAARLAVGLDEHVGDALPTAPTFTDTAGHRVALGDLVDGHRPIVLVLAYARCTSMCSAVLRGAVEAMRASTAVAGRDYLPVVVSLDPKESPDEAARRQGRLLAELTLPEPAAWPYLVGDDAAIGALAGALGFRYTWDAEAQQFAHPAVIFTITPDGHIAQYLRGTSFAGFSEAVERATRGELSPSPARDVVACWPLDRGTRRAGAGAALLVGGLVVFSAAGRRVSRRRPG